MKLLKCRDLKSGDIMLQFNSGAIAAKIIQLAERLVGQANHSVVHAGILSDQDTIVEALTNGITKCTLRRSDHLHLSYWVWRATAMNIGTGAGTCAEMMCDIHKAQKTIAYNTFGLTGALSTGNSKPLSALTMDEILDKILHGKGHPFFCSQFVIYTYQFVAAQNGLTPSQAFNVNDAKVSPARLTALLQQSPMFQHVGLLQGGDR